MQSPLCPAEPGFRLIETFRYDPAQGYLHLSDHLARMARSAAALGVPFDAQAARACLSAPSDAVLRCRLTLDAQGGFEVTTTPLGAEVTEWRVRLHPVALDSADPWLRHKTTRRALYDTARAALPEGVDELLFLNERGELCEGTISNLFVTLESGETVTPPLSSGVLPGILRQQLLEQGQCREGVLSKADLQTARHIAMGNALRGLIPVRLLD